MAVTLVIGSQWGDEGKGKVIDYLAQKADLVVRFHGGNNAGHTIVNKWGKFPLHLVPSGVCHLRTKCLITNGVIIDLETLLGEIKNLNQAGIKTQNRLFVSPRCHLIMPYHKLLDRLYEEAKGKAKTGTTGRGIGPTYADKVSYNGLRIADLLDFKLFQQKLATQLLIKNRIIQSLGGQPLSQKEILSQFKILRKLIKPYVAETLSLLWQAQKERKMILYEGAHGVLLDNDWGTYPFCTASSTLPGSINSGSGLAAPAQRIVAIVKAYTTRVGNGPFPTELKDKEGEVLRQRGNEFGTTTGRPRRCGWLDTELVRFTCRLTGATEIALTKLDVLDGFKTIKVCTGYTLGRRRVGYLDGDSYFLEKVKPIYKTLPGWQEDISKIRRFKNLPKNCQKYIREVEKLVGSPVKIISVGPERHALVLT